MILGNIDITKSILIVWILVIFFICLIIEDLSKGVLMSFFFLRTWVHTVSYLESCRHISRPLPAHLLTLLLVEGGIIFKWLIVISWRRVINLIRIHFLNYNARITTIWYLSEVGKGSCQLLTCAIHNNLRVLSAITILIVLWDYWLVLIVKRALTLS